MQATSLIKWSQRRQYQNDVDTVYEVKVPATSSETITFKEKHSYRLTLPKETEEYTLDFKGSTIYLKGQKKGPLKPLDKIKIICDYLLVDLSEGFYTIPTNIEARVVIFSGANYTNKVGNMYTIDQENELEYQAITSLIENKKIISIKNSCLDFGPSGIKINCDSLYLENAQIIVTFNNINIDCNTISTKNSMLTATEGSIYLYSNLTYLNNTIISAGKASEFETKEYFEEGNTQINIPQNQKRY